MWRFLSDPDVSVGITIEIKNGPVGEVQSCPDHVSKSWGFTGWEVPARLIGRSSPNSQPCVLSRRNHWFACVVISTSPRTRVVSLVAGLNN